MTTQCAVSTWFATVYALADSGQVHNMRAIIREELVSSGFSRTPETNWTYERLASYLEDGWAGAQSYWTIRPEINEVADPSAAIGLVINRLVAGTRYTEEAADAARARWVFADESADLAAFVFYLTTECPVRPSTTAA